MRLSFFISILVHVLILWALLSLFRVVPQMRIPERIYSVKILQPIVRARGEPAAEKPVTVKSEALKKPVPAKPNKAQKAKKPEQKPEPAPESKPMDLSVGGKAKDQTSLVVDAPRFPFSYYLEAVERKVSQNWFAGTSGGVEGLSCIVYFQLHRDGSVRDVRVEQSSGNSYFDSSALRAVRGSEPFPPLPRAFTEAFLGIHFTFVQKE